VLVQFYDRVQPAGWWRRTAAAAGADPYESLRRLHGGLAAVLVCAVSLFLLLYGAGGLLIRSPVRPPVAPLGALVLGLALVPVWYRRLRRG
jgi:solute:Na+ symporter, SSS family